MAYLSPRVLDLGLDVLTNEATRLDITTTEASTYTEAVVTYTLGYKASVSIGSPEDRFPSGRKVVVSAFSDGVTTADGTAAYWAITDTVNYRLLATGSLSATGTIVSGDTFSLQAFDIGIPSFELVELLAMGGGALLDMAGEPVYGMGS